MQLRTSWMLALILAMPVAGFADFRYDETSKITGGSIVNMTKSLSVFSKNAHQMTDPVNSTVLVKGNRMAHIDQQTSEIIDLDSETVTNIDHVKKTYTVVTFQEMKAAMEEAEKKAQQAQPSAPQTPQPPATPSGPPPEMHFKVTVTNTGASKQVVGLSATQSILKMSLESKDQQSGQTGNMAMTNDMWMVPEIPGYNEVREFNERMAAKMSSGYSGTMPSAMSSSMSPQMLQAQPGMFTGMADMAKEMSKLHGVPVSQIMRMGSTTDGTPLPAASEAALPQSNGPTTGSVANQAANNVATSATDSAAANAESKAGSHMGSFGGVPSSLGNLGFGGFHKKKPQPQQQAAATPAQNWSVLMESTTEYTNLSSASIDPSLFKVPTGYTKVPSEYQKTHQ